MAEENKTEAQQPSRTRQFVIKFVCVFIACIAAHALLDTVVGHDALQEIPLGKSVGTGVGIAIGIVIVDFLARR